MAGNQAMLLQVDHIAVAFGGVHAVDDLSFNVPDGSITGLIGPNGAGKSTALKLIGGEVLPDSGTIMFDGVDVTRQPPHRRARAGLIRTFQLGGEFARLTVLENLLMGVHGMRGATLWGALAGRRWWGTAQDEEVRRARDILASLDLLGKQDLYAGELSGGQRKLMEIGRALMSRPRMLLMDEPMAGVNRSMARRIESALTELRGEGLTMVIVEHELGTVERLCDQVVVMSNGRRIAEGDMGGLRSRQEVLNAYLGG